MKSENRMQDKGNPDSYSPAPVGLRIAYVIERFPSPTEYFILNEVLELEKRGFEIYILVLRKQKQYFDMPEIENLKSRVIYLPQIFFFLPFFSVLLFPFFIFRYRDFVSWSPVAIYKQLRNYSICLFFSSKLRKKGINHIHAHFAFISTDIAYFLSKQLNVKYSFTSHAHDIYANSDSKLRKLANEASFVITCTQYNWNHINQITGFKNNNKLFTVYHGIDSSKWKLSGSRKGLALPTINILSVARLVEKKGLPFLLEAVKLLIEQGTRVQCTIIGEGPLQKQLKVYIREMGLNNYVDLFGFVPQDEIKRYLSGADIFVLPCIVAENGDRDGLPNVILEAMLMGVPVISTPVSAIPEVIEDRVTGMLVKEKDSQTLANAISELVNNRELYDKIVENSKRKILKEFSIQKSTEKLVEVFINNI